MGRRGATRQETQPARVDEPAMLQSLLDNLGRDVIQVTVADRHVEPAGRPAYVHYGGRAKRRVSEE